MGDKVEEFYSVSSTHEEIRDTNIGYQSAYEVCPDRSLHQRFIPVDKFNFSCLPRTFQTDIVLRLIHLMSRLTVRIWYNFLEETGHAQKTCLGTGFIQRIKRHHGQLCPCHDCREKEDVNRSKSWFKLSITTVRSVFNRFDSKNGSRARADLFYDNEGDSSNAQIQTVDIASRDGGCAECGDEMEDDDWLVCFGVTHNGALVEDLMKCLEDYEKLQESTNRWYKDECDGGSKLAVVVGHPHGGPKRVSVGQDLRRMDIGYLRDSQVLCRYAYDAVTCPGSGGSPVYVCGQPICGFGYWFGHPHNHARGYTQRSRDVVRQYSFSSVGMDHSE